MKGKVEAIEGGGYKNAEILRYRRCPNLAAISRKPSTLTTAAIASFNTSVTGSKHAIFGMLMAGREWPFINDSLAQLLPDPMTVAGPTLTTTVVAVNVDDTEKISQFLGRLEAELRLLRRYQHVPLDFPAHLEDEDRAVWHDAPRQLFNYQPRDTAPKCGASADSPLTLFLDRDYKVDESSKYFVWECGLQDSATLRIRALFDPDMFSERQVTAFTESVFDAVDFLSDMGNWEKKVREMRAVVSKKESRLQSPLSMS